METYKIERKPANEREDEARWKWQDGRGEGDSLQVEECRLV